MDQKTALEVLKTGENVFLTGEAGSGKTHVTKQYIEFLNDNNIKYEVTSTTGITAIPLGGHTIHKFLGVGRISTMSEESYNKYLEYKNINIQNDPYHPFIDSDSQTYAMENGQQYQTENSLTESYFNYIKKYGTNTLIKELDVLIIDEISMMQGTMFVMIDYIFRHVRGGGSRKNDIDNPKYKPFGGCKVVFVGDFMQLPPIKRGNIPQTFAYQTDAWKSLDLKTCYLTEQHRQNRNSEFYQILNRVRHSQVTKEDLDKLNARSALHANTNTLRLYSTNLNTDSYNEERLAQINSESKQYVAAKEGDTFVTNDIVKNMLCPEVLNLKVGARVMAIVNDYHNMYQNGSLGEVVEISETNEGGSAKVKVKFDNGNLCEISPCDFKRAGWILHNFNDSDSAKSKMKDINGAVNKSLRDSFMSMREEKFLELEGGRQIYNEVRELGRTEFFGRMIFSDKDQYKGYSKALNITMNNFELKRPYLKTYEAGKYVVHEWHNAIGVVRQLPLKLAYAVTIHKSQGQTFDSAVIDFSRMFSQGMGYVALTRLKSLDGLFLERGTMLNINALRVNQNAQNYDKQLIGMSKQTEDELTLNKFKPRLMPNGTQGELFGDSEFTNT